MSFLYLLTVFCTSLFLWACGDGGTSEPILYPEQSLAKSSSSDVPESLGTESSASYATFICMTGTEEDCDYGMLVDERDGQTYKTLKVGGQVWMAENLNYQIGVKHCFHDSCAQYGRYYSWSTAMDSAGVFSTNGLGCGDGLICSPDYPVRGICPAGWHLPNKFEIEPLVPELGGLMEIVAQGEDSSMQSIFAERFLTRTDMWSSTDENENMTSFLFFDNESYSLYPATCMKYRLLSVRCVKGQSAGQNMDKLLSFSAQSSSSSVRVNSSSSSEGLYISYGEMTDERDGHIYKAMTISGTLYDVFYPKQIWMAENLNYAYLQSTSTQDSSSWCYGNDSENCKRYGRLYLWSAAIDSAAVFSEDAKGCGYFATDDEWVKCSSERKIRGVCPEEWRLPTYNEYYKLLFWRLRDGRGFAEDQLLKYFKDAEGQIWGSSHFWLATEKSNTMAFRDDFIPGSLEYSEGYPLSGALPPEDKRMVHSVRCVKDIPD